MSPDRLSRFSQRMATITLWFLIAMMLLNAACWLFPQLSSIDGGYGFGFSLTNQLIVGLNVQVESLPWWQQAGGIVLSSIPLFVLAFGLYQLSLLFKTYARKEYFSVMAATRLGKIGQSIGIWIILNLICEPLLGFWLTMREPVGQRVVTLSLGTSDIVALFLATCIILIAQILRKASDLHVENQQFV